MITLTLPMSLKKYTDNINVLEMEHVEDFEALLCVLVEKHPLLKTKIFSHSGQLHNFINVFIDGKNIRHLNGEKTKLDQRSTVTVVAAIAGG